MRKFTCGKYADDELLEAILMADDSTLRSCVGNQVLTKAMLEMAAAVVLADGRLSDAEREFLSRLERQLGAEAQLYELLRWIAQCNPVSDGELNGDVKKAIGILGIEDPRDIAAVKKSYRR